MEWFIANFGSVAAVIFAIIRVVESIMVVLKNEKGLSIIKVIKEFFKLS